MTIDYSHSQLAKLVLTAVLAYLTTACSTTDDPVAGISCFGADGNSLDCSVSSSDTDTGVAPLPDSDSDSGSDSGSSTPKSLTISWVAPSARADGSSLPLSEIAGYRIYFGTSAGNYSNTITIGDGSVVQGTINNLNSGTSYYFAMTTIDTDGRESAYSAEYRVTL